MWADTLLTAERAHLLRLVAWSIASALTGTALLAWSRAGRGGSPLLEQFATQTALWGATELALTLGALRALAPRDLSAATRLDRLLWLAVGLEGGLVALGVTLAVSAWALARHLGAVGAGLGVALQGAGLLVLHLLLVAQISR